MDLLDHLDLADLREEQEQLDLVVLRELLVTEDSPDREVKLEQLDPVVHRVPEET